MSNTRLLFNVRYEFYGQEDGWFKSKEDVERGSVRFVRDSLFHAHYSSGGYTYWLPVNRKNDADEIKKFQLELLSEFTPVK